MCKIECATDYVPDNEKYAQPDWHRPNWRIWNKIHVLIIIDCLLIEWFHQSGLPMYGKAHWWHDSRWWRQRCLFTAFVFSNWHFQFNRVRIVLHVRWNRWCQVAWSFTRMQSLRNWLWRHFSRRRIDIFAVILLWSWHRSRSIFSLFCQTFST